MIFIGATSQAKKPPPPRPPPPKPGPKAAPPPRAPSGGIQIVKAMYGQGRRWRDYRDQWGTLCNGKYDCLQKIDNRFGDPAGGDDKFLKIDWRCASKPEVRHAEGKEYGTVYLFCAPMIKVVLAVYESRPKDSGDTQWLERNCNGRPRCSANTCDRCGEYTVKYRCSDSPKMLERKLRPGEALNIECKETVEQRVAVAASEQLGKAEQEEPPPVVALPPDTQPPAERPQPLTAIEQEAKATWLKGLDAEARARELEDEARRTVENALALYIQRAADLERQAADLRTQANHAVDGVLKPLRQQEQDLATKVRNALAPAQQEQTLTQAFQRTQVTLAQLKLSKKLTPPMKAQMQRTEQEAARINAELPRLRPLAAQARQAAEPLSKQLAALRDRLGKRETTAEAEREAAGKREDAEKLLKDALALRSSAEKKDVPAAATAEAAEKRKEAAGLREQAKRLRNQAAQRVIQPLEGPHPTIFLASTPRVVPPPSDADQVEKDAAKTNPEVAAERKKKLAERDRIVVPSENVDRLPSSFCVASGSCFGSYAEVARSLYGSPTAGPVFCAPKLKPGGGWEDKVTCSARWLDTLGTWSPWTDTGAPSAPAEPQAIPPYACFGSPHLVDEHMVLPPGGEAGSGFRCRKRIFRVLAKAPETSAEEKARNISLLCAEMRMQVWGEKYPTISKQYQEWCRSDPERVKRGLCAPPDAFKPGAQGGPDLPFLPLSREELLFFFGHGDLYCRADRPGLTHMLHNQEWAQSFTCAVPRGLLEAGPFEEGVQACALVPFGGDEPVGGGLEQGHLKARLHCWQFNRPTCEEISRDQTKDDIRRSSLFDVVDALREARRTRAADAWALYDLKDAEKLADWQEALAFADTARDEGVFGVKDFCRFTDQSLRRLQCGYTKQSIAAWYALRKNEEPAGCELGVCRRGAYRRGYYCGLFSAPELLGGKPHWICGLDSGGAARELLRSARALCLGGEKRLSFQSAHGERGSLHCFERRFRWGESTDSLEILRSVSWGRFVREAKQGLDPPFDPMLAGQEVVKELRDAEAVRRNPAMVREAAQANEEAIRSLQAKVGEARKGLLDRAAKDVEALARWATKYGHTLGHRTSLRLAVLDAPLLAVQEFKKLRLRKELAGTLEEVRGGSRAPDGRWLQLFRADAVGGLDGTDLRIEPKDLEVVFRVHHLFEVLARARVKLLQRAQQYADSVFAAAGRLLPRPSILEKSRSLPETIRGSVFCAAHPKEVTPSGLPVFACGASPLLIAGAVERLVRGDYQNLWARKPPGVQEVIRDKLRRNIKFGWCYGGLKGGYTYGTALIPTLFTKNASSPFELEVPPSVVSGAAPKTTNTTHWLKCAGFQYSDEVWEDADPARAARTAPVANLPASAAQSRAGGKTARITQQVGGLTSALVALVLPLFPDAQERVEDLTKFSGGFLDGWSGKFLAKAKPYWEKLSAGIREAKKKVEEGASAVKDRETEVARAELNVCAATGPAKEKAERERNEAKQKLTEAQRELKAREAGLAGTKTEARKGAAVPGTGELMNGMLEDLLKIVTKRLSGIVTPFARKLLTLGLKFVRAVLDPIVQAVIGALAEIPFVGGAIAPLANIAYSAALMIIEEVGGILLGMIVERVLATTLRGVVTPVLREVQGKILELAYGACAKIDPAVCPKEGGLKFSALPAKDQWIARVMSCPGRQVIGPEIRRDAELARRQILGTAARMRRETAALSRDLANIYLARYGLTYDSWMAAVAQGATPSLLARASAISRDLEKRAAVERARGVGKP
jgi:hypothetical protein